MDSHQVSKLIDILERELPAQRNDNLCDKDRLERIALWATSLKEYDYSQTIQMLPELLSKWKWFPRLNDFLNAIRVDPMDKIAENHANIRAKGKAWIYNTHRDLIEME